MVNIFSVEVCSICDKQEYEVVGLLNGKPMCRMCVVKRGRTEYAGLPERTEKYLAVKYA